MDKRAIIGILLGTIIIIGGLIWLGPPAVQKEQAAAESVLQSDAVMFDFGTISMANGNVSHAFKVVNSSDQPVTVKKIYSSCMCTAAEFSFNGRKYGPFSMEGMGISNAANITINPGDTGELEAIYDPNAHGPAGVGAIDRFVYLEDKNGGRLELEIKAVVTP